MKWLSLLLLLTGLASLSGQQSDTVFIHPLIKEYLSVREAISCMLVVEDQTGPPSLKINTPKDEKTTQMYDRLHRLASQTQKSIVDSLEAWDIDHHPFYIINAIQVSLDSIVLDQLKHQPGLRAIFPDFPLVSPPGLVRPGSIRRRDTLIHWRISHIHANSVWNMGITVLKMLKI